mmetsp:Transcript_17671/g.41062  ORF Transcript_17671/g.41062 Transcript_17671/m.41062 type:complete len:366 (-) Transcript_17671:346-1443(-)
MATKTVRQMYKPYALREAPKSELSATQRCAASSSSSSAATTDNDNVIVAAQQPQFVDSELNFESGPAEVRIWNGRGESHTLEKDGFQLLHTSLPEDPHAVDWYEPQEAADYLFPLAEQALMDLCPGAKRVVVFDHIARNAARVESAEAAQLAAQSAGDKTELVDGNGLATQLLAAPGKMVHGDYTARSGAQRTRELLAPFESPNRIEAAMRGRVALINLWVPLKRVQRDPLAMVEWSTSAPEDVIRVKRIHPHRVGEIYHGLPSDRHRWVYYPDMEPGEVLAFKTYDSAEDGRPRFVIHSAFSDPTAAADAPPRESIELRCIVFFGDEVPSDFATEFIPPHLDPTSPDHDLTPPELEKSEPMSEW